MRPVKRSFTIRGHRTSISLEPAFWNALQEASATLNLTPSQLVAMIDETRNDDSGLSTAVRVWLLNYFRGPDPAATFDGGNRD